MNSDQIKELSQVINGLSDGEMRDLFELLSDEAIGRVHDQVREDILEDMY